MLSGFPSVQSWRHPLVLSSHSFISVVKNKSNTIKNPKIIGGIVHRDFENVARLEKLPSQGFTVIALPAKIGGGSGGPLRIIAMIDG